MIEPYALDMMYDELVKVGFLGGVARGLVTAAGRKLTESGASAAVRSAGGAAGRYLAQSAGNVGAGMGIGGAAGGVIGAAEGGYRGYKEDQAQGGGGVMGGLMGALGGGTRGAAIGTAIGGAAGLASGGRGADIVAKATKGAWNPLGMAARSGQRQLHSVTGLAPGGAARGTEAYAKALTEINAGGLGNLAKAVDKAKNPQQRQAAEAAYARAVQGAQAGQTSVVGMARNLQQKGLREGGKDILEHGVKNTLRQGVAPTVMAAGVPVALAASEAVRPDDPNDPNAPKKGERVARTLGSGAAGVLAPMVGSTGGELISRATGAAGGLVGKGIDKIVGAVQRKSPNSLGGGATTPGAEPGLAGPPVERVYSNAAQGKPPEDLQV